MFERYTEGARRALFFARYEAAQTGGGSVEAEHLLLGLIHDPRAIRCVIERPQLDGLRSDVLKRMVVSAPQSVSVEIPFSSQAKRALQFAAQEADTLQDHHIGAEHLLLGLLREQQSAAAQVLMAHGLTLAAARTRVAGAPEQTGAELPRPIDIVVGIEGILGQIDQPGLPAAALDVLARIRRDLHELRRLLD
jgi:ATP-dependent Clp protease ATP-binding subunit ClpC